MSKQKDADFFRAWRKRHGLAEAAAADLLGVDVKTITRYEAGETALPSVAKLACETLDSQALVGGGFKGYVWRIERFDGAERTFVRDVPRSELDLLEVTQLLACLSARHLSDAEIVAAALGENLLLEWRRANGASGVAFTAGRNPHYIVSLQRGDETP